jgi:anti-anti-sigma factor
LEEAILYKDNGDSIYVKAKGHIRAAICTGLRDLVYARLEQPGINNVYIDLSECDYMDSTFMGLIVSFKKKMSANSRGNVHIVKANEVCLGLLKTIGLTRLVTVDNADIDFPPFMEDIVEKDKATAQFILDVHENLMDISDENKNRFSSLKSVLLGQIEADKTKDE